MNRYSIVLVMVCIMAVPQGVHASTFSDVPVDHPALVSIEALAERKILIGYADNTFRPFSEVSRAEVVTMLGRALLKEGDYNDASSVFFTDVPQQSWYENHLNVLVHKSAINGPPKATEFYPGRTVNLAEFLKMLFELDTQNINRYAHEEKSIAEDVDDMHKWYYPYIAHGVSTAMITPYLDDSLHPEKKLTRAEVAMYLHRYLSYREGKNVQRVLKLFDENVDAFYKEYVEGEDSDLAEQISFRAILLSQGVRTSSPASADFLALQKVSWGLGKLAQGEKKMAVELFTQAQVLSKKVYEKYVTKTQN